jgi:hypothetical protein
MSSIYRFKLLAFVLVSAVLLAMAAPMVLAEGTAQAAPDISVIVGSTGNGVSRANVYVDGNLAGTTDSKGNLTFKEAPAAGNHSILVSAKGITNTTAETNFAIKPVVVKAIQSYPGKTFNVHISDKSNKNGIAGASLYSGKYLIGTTNSTGDIALSNFPGGLYLVKINKDGYSNASTLLIVYNNKTQNFVLSPK